MPIYIVGHTDGARALALNLAVNASVGWRQPLELLLNSAYAGTG